jgi:hypothetical protein
MIQILMVNLQLHRITTSIPSTPESSVKIDEHTEMVVQRESNFVADIETSDSEIELHSIQKDGNTRERL